MDQVFICQSCGMPIDNDEEKGTCADGSRSLDYCGYCYKEGGFTQELTMDEMIEINLKYLDQWNETVDNKMSAEEAREQLRVYLPALKRWKTAE